MSLTHWGLYTNKKSTTCLLSFSSYSMHVFSLPSFFSFGKNWGEDIIGQRGNEKK